MNRQSSSTEAPPAMHKTAVMEAGWRLAYPLGILSLALLLLVYHFRIITAPIPLDYYEGVMPLITGIIADGHNPYTRAFQPQAMDVYPPLYNIVTAPVSLLFGNTLETHRAVSALFIFLSVGLCALACYRQTRSRADSAAAGVMIYAALLFYSTPVASTNALGIFLYLSILLVPWLCRFSRKSLAAALLCGLLAFYAKQYFIAAMGILCLYLFLYRCKLTALLFGACYALLLAGSVLVVHLTSPYYLDNTLFSAGISIYLLLSSDTLLRQIAYYARTYWPLLLILLAAAIRWLQVHERGDLALLAQRYLALGEFRLRGPLLRTPPDYFLFCFFWASVVTFATMGRNPGNFMTYLFQLMSPFLVIGGFAVVARLERWTRLLLPLVLVAFTQVYVILPRDFSTTRESWARVEQIIAESDEIYASQMLLMLMIKHGKKIYQDGHTHYFPVAAQKPAMFVRENPQDRVDAVWNQYLTDIFRKIERKEFDVILVNPWDFRGMFTKNTTPFSQENGKVFLKEYYYLDEAFPLSMTDRYGGGTYEMRVWRPKP